MVFSNFGAPLYERFESIVTIDGDDFPVEFMDLKDNGDLKVKVTIPMVDGDKEGENVKCYTIKPKKPDLGTFKNTFDNLDMELSDFLKKITIDKDELTKIFNKEEEEDADEEMEEDDSKEVPVKYDDSLIIIHLFSQDSSESCDDDGDGSSNSTTQASTTQASNKKASTTQASNKKASNNNNKNKNKNNKNNDNDTDDEDDDDDDDDDDDEADDDEDDTNEPFVGNRIEGFNGTGNNRNTIAHNFNMKLLLKSLLFSCLFYLLAHGDTRNTLLKVLKVDKEHYLYLGTAIFFIIYLILNILI